MDRSVFPLLLHLYSLRFRKPALLKAEDEEKHVRPKFAPLYRYYAADTRDIFVLNFDRSKEATAILMLFI